MSSQQQSQGYKRRSSGRRTRPSQRPGSTTVVERDDQILDAEAEEVVRETPKAERAPRQPREIVSRSKLDSLVNTQRFDGLRKYVRESSSEIQKVIWPDRETTRNLTIVVIAVSVVLGLLLGGIDFVLFQLFEALP